MAVEAHIVGRKRLAALVEVVQGAGQVTITELPAGQTLEAVQGEVGLDLGV